MIVTTTEANALRREAERAGDRNELHALRLLAEADRVDFYQTNESRVTPGRAPRLHASAVMGDGTRCRPA